LPLNNALERSIDFGSRVRPQDINLDAKGVRSVEQKLRLDFKLEIGWVEQHSKGSCCGQYFPEHL
jgi:hypothetical protein